MDIKDKTVYSSARNPAYKTQANTIYPDKRNCYLLSYLFSSEIFYGDISLGLDTVKNLNYFYNSHIYNTLFISNFNLSFCYDITLQENNIKEWSSQYRQKNKMVFKAEVEKLYDKMLQIKKYKEAQLLEIFSKNGENGLFKLLDIIEKHHEENDIIDNHFEKTIKKKVTEKMVTRPSMGEITEIYQRRYSKKGTLQSYRHPFFEHLSNSSCSPEYRERSGSPESPIRKRLNNEKNLIFNDPVLAQIKSNKNELKTDLKSSKNDFTDYMPDEIIMENKKHIDSQRTRNDSAFRNRKSSKFNKNSDKVIVEIEEKSENDSESQSSNDTEK